MKRVTQNKKIKIPRRSNYNYKLHNLDLHLFDEVAHATYLYRRKGFFKLTQDEITDVMLYFKYCGDEEYMAVNKLDEYVFRATDPLKPKSYKKEKREAWLAFKRDDIYLRENKPINFSKEELNTVDSVENYVWKEELFWFYSIAKHRMMTKRELKPRLKLEHMRKLTHLVEKDFDLFIKYLRDRKLITFRSGIVGFKGIGKRPDGELSFKCHEQLVAYWFKHRGSSGIYQCNLCGQWFLGQNKLCSLCTKNHTI